MKTKLTHQNLFAALGCLAFGLALAPGCARAETFTIAVIPDTREYTRWDHTTPGFMAETHFIATNCQALNIAFVSHLGDMVKASWCPYNWMRAVTAMDVLRTDCDVPIGIAIGDLDYENTSPPVNGTETWSIMFGPGYGPDSSFSDGRDWQHRNPLNPPDSYQVFYGADRAYLHVVLEVEPSSQTLAWAQQAIDDHLGMPTIITIHQFLLSNGSLSGNTLRRGSTAAQIWDRLVRTNSQVFMVLCGHNPGEVSRVTANARGEPVFQYLSDYYNVSLGNGWIRLMEFDPDAGRFQVKTYSAVLNSWQTDANSQFTVNFDWNARFGPAPARLPPLIITPPASQEVACGGSLSFRVFAKGTGPLSYQWRKDGLPLPGATGTSFHIPIARQSEHGSGYSVVVSDPYTCVTSTLARVTVTTPVVYNFGENQPSGANLTAFAFRANAGLYPDSVYPPGALTETFRLQNITFFRPYDTNGPSFGTGYGALSGPDAPVYLDVYADTNGMGGFSGYLGSSTNFVTWSDLASANSYSFSFAGLGLRSDHKYWTVFSEDPLEGEVSNFRAFMDTSGTDNTPGSGQGYLVRDKVQAFAFPNLSRDWAPLFVAEFRLNHPPVADAGAGQTAFISGLATDATVVLDGTRSSDPDEDLLHYAWGRVGQSQTLTTGAVAAALLPVGTHSLALIVSDGLLSATNALTVQVLTAADATDQLLDLVRTGAARARPLMATVSAALASIGRGNAISAINQLQAFQNKARAQFQPLDPTLAAQLIANAQAIIDSLADPQTNPAGRPHGKITSVELRPGRSVRLRSSAESGRIHILQASTNLLDWEMVAVGKANGDGTFAFEDLNAPQFQNRFYRVVTP